MTPEIWIVVSLLFGPMKNSPEFTNRSACIIYLGTVHKQVVDSFQLSCAKR